MTRILGRSGLAVTPLGLGCMGMNYAYGPSDRNESIATIRRALDLEENVRSLELALTTEDMARLYALRPVGERYPDMSWVKGDTASLPG